MTSARALLVALLFALAAASASRAQSSAPQQAPTPAGGPRIYAISLEGADQAGLLSSLGIEQGSPLDTRDVREAVRRLHATAQFSRVAAWVEDIPQGQLPAGFGPGVKLIFVVKPVRRLIAVSFPGHEVLADSILHQTADLQVKSEYQPEALTRAVEAISAAYYRIGYRHVRVEPVATETKEGVSLELKIDEGQPTRIAELRFVGCSDVAPCDLGLTRDELTAAFKPGVGEVLNLSTLDESLRSLRDRYRDAGRLRARVDAPRIVELDDRRAQLTVTIQVGPKVSFVLRGNRAFTSALLQGKLGLDPSSDEQLDAQLEDQMAGRLRNFYVSAGWLGARVAQREMRARDGSVDIVFAIDEGHRTFVDEVQFEGNKHLASARLRDMLFQLLSDAIPSDAYPGTDPGEVEQSGVMGRLPAPRPARTRTSPVRVFDPGVYARALREIEDLYKSEGYLNAHAGPPRLLPRKTPGHVAVIIPVAEGDRAIVSTITIEGGQVVPVPELDAAVTLGLGGAFSYLAAEEGRAALTQIFTRRGYLYARVDDEETFLEGAAGRAGDVAGIQKVSVRYRIQEGPLVRVSLIEVEGQRRTKEDLILDLIALKPGDILTPEVLDRGQQQLLRTGLFFSATLTPLNPEVAEGEKSLLVALRERPTTDVVVSGGFSLADGPRATVQYIQGNLFGRNLTFSAVAKADYPFIRYLQENSQSCNPTGNAVFQVQCDSGYQQPSDPIERVLDLGISAPRLYPLTDKLRAGIDLIHQRAVRASYRLTKYSVQLSTGLTTRRPLDLGLQYEVGYQQLTHANFSIEDYLAGVDRSIFRQPSGNFLLGSLRPTITVDLRDDPGRPRSGFYFQASGDYLTSLSTNSTFPIDLFRYQGLVAAYLPLPARSSMVFDIRAGRVVQLNPASQTPGDRRFYLGGATSLRGFYEDALQPQDLVDSLHRQVATCRSTLTGVGCSPQVLALQTFGTSDGGDQFLLLNAELRVPVAASTELAFFYDAGNLWLLPRSFVSNLSLRDAAGIGLRYATPIGRIAIDIGINLNPDPALNEPRLGPYFSINTL